MMQNLITIIKSLKQDTLYKTYLSINIYVHHKTIKKFLLHLNDF